MVIISVFAAELSRINSYDLTPKGGDGGGTPFPQDSV